MTWAALAPVWVTFAVGLGALLFIRRFGGGTALAELERANGILSRRVGEQAVEIERLTSEVAALKASRDVSLAIVPVLEALKLHEERASVRSDAHLRVLEMIAERLGADPEAEAA